MNNYVPIIQTLLWIVLLVAAAVIFRSDVRALRTALAYRLEHGSQVKFGPFELGELRRDVQDVKHEISDLDRRVTRALLLAMSDGMFENLDKLGQLEGFGQYVMEHGFERELRYLRDLGYVDTKTPIGEIPREGPQLSSHVGITDRGRTYVQLRRDLSTTNQC